MKTTRTRLLLASVLLALTASCSSRDDVQEEEWQEQEVIKTEAEAEIKTLMESVADYSVSLAVLLEKSWKQTATEKELADMAYMIGTAPQKLQDEIDYASAVVNEWWVANERQGEIDEAAGASPLLKYGGAALGIATLIGLPTSGPFAPYLAWLTPLLRLSRMRNEVKRDESRAKFAMAPKP